MGSVFFGIATRSFHYSHTLGRSEYSGSGFRYPLDLALAGDGVIYVVNRSRQDRVEGVRVTVLTMHEDFIRDFGRFGEGDGEFVWPISITLDSDGHAYVADQWLNRISIFDEGGEFVGKWGTAGEGDGQLNQPTGIVFDAEDNLYVADSHNNRIQVYNRDGKFLAKWGEAGSGPGQFNRPWGIAIDHNGDVYVADWRNDRVQKFTSKGEFLAEFGSSGAGVGEFNRPADVAVDKDGDIYVADWGNDRVEVFTSDGRHITTFTGDSTLSKWGQAKLEANPDQITQRNLVRDFEPERRFSHPVAIQIDDQGRILVLEASRHRIQVYQKDNY